MRLIVAGCEYSGASTLSRAIGEWAKKTMGADMKIYDSFMLPYFLPLDMTEEELEQFDVLPKHLKQVFQWHNLASHTMPDALKKDDYILVGFQLYEAVYAPLYYGYGRPWDYAEAVGLARHYEVEIMESMPSLVQVLVKASPDAIAKRMEDDPHEHGLLQSGPHVGAEIKGEIGHVLERFEEVASQSLIRRKITIDTTNATVDESVVQFVKQFDRYFSSHDLVRILAHR